MDAPQLTVAESVAAAVCTVARSPAPLFEHAPAGPLADGIREATTLGFLKAVGNGTVEITESGRALAAAKDSVWFALTHLQCRKAVADSGRSDDLYVI